MHTAALRGARARRRVDLRGDRGLARGVRAPGRRAARARLRGRQRDGPAQAAALAIADERLRRGARRSAPRTRSASPTAADPRRQHRRAGPDRGAAASRPAGSARSCSAPAARRARRSGRCAEAGAEVCGLEPHRGARREALAAELGVRAVAERTTPRPRARFELVVNATSVGLRAGVASARRAAADLKALRLDADSFCDRQVVVDLVYGSDDDRARRARAQRRGDRRSTASRSWSARGPSRFRIWTGPSPARGDAKSGNGRSERRTMTTRRAPGTPAPGPGAGLREATAPELEPEASRRHPGADAAERAATRIGGRFITDVDRRARLRRPASGSSRRSPRRAPPAARPSGCWSSRA